MPRRVYDSSTSSESLDLFVNFLSCGPLSRAIRLIECIMCRNRNRNRNRNRSREYHSTLEGFDVEVLEPLGEGGFGRVFRCRDCNTGRIVAVKEIAILDLYEGVPSSIIREVSLLKELHHDNIVRLLNVMSRDNKYVNLVFEHLDCDLYQYITDPCYPKDSITRKSFLYQILSAVTYCHTHRVLHRDLKPRNLLIDLSKMTIKLADFGLAREFGEPDMLYTQKIATRWYRAPEILLKSHQYSTPIDLWSVGCIFGEMVIGQPIFRALNCHDELEAIFRMLGTPTEETWPGVTKLSTHLKNYAKFDPLDLSTIFADLEPDGLNLLSMMLCLDPNKRISAEAALQHAYFNDMNLVSHLLLS